MRVPGIQFSLEPVQSACERAHRVLLALNGTTELPSLPARTASISAIRLPTPLLQGTGAWLQGLLPVYSHLRPEFRPNEHAGRDA